MSNVTLPPQSGKRPRSPIVLEARRMAAARYASSAASLSAALSERIPARRLSRSIVEGAGSLRAEADRKRRERLAG